MLTLEDMMKRNPDAFHAEIVVRGGKHDII